MALTSCAVTIGLRFSPREVLSELHQLALESAAKIILTTRTMYWESEFGQSTDLSGTGSPDTGLTLFDSCALYKAAGSHFLRETLPGRAIATAENARPSRSSKCGESTSDAGWREEADSVSSLYRRAGGLSRRRRGGGYSRRRPRQLHAQASPPDVRPRAGSAKLETPPQDQLAALEAVAVDCISRGTSAFDEDLCIIAGFREEDRARLKDHPLIDAKSDMAGDPFRFRYDFLPQILTVR